MATASVLLAAATTINWPKVARSVFGTTLNGGARPLVMMGRERQSRSGMSGEVPRTRRKRPGKIGRWLARAPLFLYRIGLGRLLGRRFVMLVHTGRKTGLRRDTLLEAVARDAAAIYVAAAWGSKSDWLRNVMANPAVRISTGALQDAPAHATVVSPEKAKAVFDLYVRDHPVAARALASTLGLPLGDPSAMAATVPVVRLAVTL